MMINKEEELQRITALKTIMMFLVVFIMCCLPYKEMDMEKVKIVPILYFKDCHILLCG